MKKRLAVLLCLTAAAAALVWLFYWMSRETTAVALNWGIHLPDCCTELDRYSDQGGFSGDGCRYNRLRYQSDVRLLTCVAWECGRNQEAEEMANAWLDRLAVPDDLRPDFCRPYDCYTATGEGDPRDHICLFYFPEDKLLYILQSFL